MKCSRCNSGEVESSLTHHRNYKPSRQLDKLSRRRWRGLVLQLQDRVENRWIHFGHVSYKHAQSDSWTTRWLCKQLKLLFVVSNPFTESNRRMFIYTRWFSVLNQCKYMVWRTSTQFVYKNIMRQCAISVVFCKRMLVFRLQGAESLEDDWWIRKYGKAEILA